MEAPLKENHLNDKAVQVTGAKFGGRTHKCHKLAKQPHERSIKTPIILDRLAFQKSLYRIVCGAFEIMSSIFLSRVEIVSTAPGSDIPTVKSVPEISLIQQELQMAETASSAMTYHRGSTKILDHLPNKDRAPSLFVSYLFFTKLSTSMDDIEIATMLDPSRPG